MRAPVTVTGTRQVSNVKLWIVISMLLAACIPVAVPDTSSTAATTLTPTETNIPLPTEETGLPDRLNLDQQDWQEWPVIPIVTENARTIYLHGQTLGNNPHTFSLFADCLSLPRAFLGVYANDSETVAGLAPNLGEAVTWFSGSFYRENPTVRSGTTVASLLWWAWHENKYGCGSSETPIQCELRIHKPSFVIIQVGTHSVERNKAYMGDILEQLIAAGVVPILGTKADNTEMDMHVNAEYAQLASEYDIPLWNFWAAVQSLPKHGLHTTDENPELYRGDLYLTEEAKAVHRLTALESLEAVWRAVTTP